jgi:putative aldouronate transport system substrate-binding protein
MELNFHISVIKGSKKVDDFDAFVKDWKAQGGDQITKEVNAWYKA